MQPSLSARIATSLLKQQKGKPKNPPPKQKRNPKPHSSKRIAAFKEGSGLAIQLHHLVKISPLPHTAEQAKF